MEDNEINMDYDPHRMVGKFVVLDEVPCEKIDTGETEYYTGVFKVIQWDELNYGFYLESNDDLQEQYWAPAEYVTPSEISEPEINTLDQQYALPAADHPLGEHTGNTGNPQDYVQQWIHYDQPITMEHDGSFVDMQGPFFVAKYIEPKRLFALITQEDYENHQQDNIYYVDESQVTLDNLAAGEQVDNLEELFQQPPAQHPLGPHTGNMTETEIDQGFRASMERIYRSLLEVGYSANEAQAQVKKLIAEIEQERQALEQPLVEEDVSLDRLTMPAEHLGWYQADFHEKGNEDLELPNVEEEIVMPDEPTGLEKN